jgi:hypothetical protein
MNNEPDSPRKSTQPCTSQAHIKALLEGKLAEGKPFPKAVRETIDEARGRITDAAAVKMLDWVSLGKAFEALHQTCGIDAVAIFISNLRYDTRVKAPKSIGRSLNGDWINKQLGAG